MDLKHYPSIMSVFDSVIMYHMSTSNFFHILSVRNFTLIDEFSEHETDFPGFIRCPHLLSWSKNEVNDFEVKDNNWYRQTYSAKKT